MFHVSRLVSFITICVNNVLYMNFEPPSVNIMCPPFSWSHRTVFKFYRSYIVTTLNCNVSVFNFLLTGSRTVRVHTRLIGHGAELFEEYPVEITQWPVEPVSLSHPLYDLGSDLPEICTPPFQIHFYYCKCECVHLSVCLLAWVIIVVCIAGEVCSISNTLYDHQT